MFCLDRFGACGRGSQLLMRAEDEKIQERRNVSGIFHSFNLQSSWNGQWSGQKRWRDNKQKMKQIGSMCLATLLSLTKGALYKARCEEGKGCQWGEGLQKWSSWVSNLEKNLSTSRWPHQNRRIAVMSIGRAVSISSLPRVCVWEERERGERRREGNAKESALKGEEIAKAKSLFTLFFEMKKEALAKMLLAS